MLFNKFSEHKYAICIGYLGFGHTFPKEGYKMEALVYQRTDRLIGWVAGLRFVQAGNNLPLQATYPVQFTRQICCIALDIKTHYVIEQVQDQE